MVSQNNKSLLIEAFLIYNDTFRCYYNKKPVKLWNEVATATELTENEDLVIAEVECDENRVLCQKFNIESYPSFLMIENSTEIGKFIGQRTKENFINYAKSFCEDE